MENMDIKQIGWRIKGIRNSLQMKQKEFAKTLETSVTNLSDVETGKKKPGFDLVYLLSSRHQVDLVYLLHGEGQPFRGQGGATGGPRREKPAGPDLDFGMHTRDVEELLWYMKNSRLALTALISMCKEYLYRNESIIRKDIQVTTGKKNPAAPHEGDREREDEVRSK